MLIQKHGLPIVKTPVDMIQQSPRKKPSNNGAKNASIIASQQMNI